MIKEMPEWLKKNYNALWGRYGNGMFTFEDVEKELGLSRSMTIKTLWELEKRGFVNKERSEVDYRARNYRLISPEDIAFVGFDGIPAAASFRPPLTTVRQPLETMGRLAVEHLRSLIAEETDEPLHTTVETELVVRDSCGCGGRANGATSPTGPPAEG